ncbi:MAG: hypothetical protein F6K26_02275 [Moorea sp. SIO2I5]|nr:hypothetical protein [Moorena sp. SIO2I5]
MRINGTKALQFNQPDIPVGWAVLCQGIVIVKNPIEQCPPEEKEKGKRQKAKGKRQKAKGKRQKAKGKRQKAKGKRGLGSIFLM